MRLASVWAPSGRGSGVLIGLTDSSGYICRYVREMLWIPGAQTTDHGIRSKEPTQPGANRSQEFEMRNTESGILNTARDQELRLAFLVRQIRHDFHIISAS